MAQRAFRPEKVGDFLEALYDVERDDRTWLATASETAREVWGRGGPLHSAIYDASNPAAFRTSTMHTIDLPSSAIEALQDASSALPAELVIRSVRTGLIHRSGRATAPREMDRGFGRMAQWGFPDCVTINGLDPEGQGAMVALWVTGQCDLSANEWALYGRMAHHLGAANRCRRRLRQAGANVTDGAEAVLDAQLRVIHAEGEAREAEAQVELVATATARERVRRSKADSLERWRALTEARWTLVDSFERDGKRYVVARENQARIAGLRQLTGRERQVVGYLALGQSIKETAYALGIADSTVRVLLRRAALRLGVPSRRALLAHADVVRLRTGDSTSPIA